MTKFTDANVPLKCAECNAYCEGLIETEAHILADHGDLYNAQEAAKFAQEWVEQAHIDQEEQLKDYYEERKIDKMIEATAFPNK